MGCDEHMYVEVLTDTGWKPVNPLLPNDEEQIFDQWGYYWSYNKSWTPKSADAILWNFGRSYRNYERLAGVRGDVSNAISPPRGFPKDASEEVLKDYDRWSMDAHDATYLNSNELSKESEDTRIGKLYLQLCIIAEECNVTTDKVRIIVWFDN